MQRRYEKRIAELYEQRERIIAEKDFEVLEQKKIAEHFRTCNRQEAIMIVCGMSVGWILSFVIYILFIK